MATISSNTSITVTHKVSSSSGDLMYKQYKSLTINDNCTLGTDQRCRGLWIYVQGNLVLGSNAHIQMHYKSPKDDPTADDAYGEVPSTGWKYGVFKTGGTDTLAAIDMTNHRTDTETMDAVWGKVPVLSSGSGTTNFKYINLPRTSSNGAAGRADTGGYGGGIAGSSTSWNGGGGGSGGACFGTSGAGGNGTLWGGGSGSGGTGGNFNSDSTSSVTYTSGGTAGSNSGGAGGADAGGLLVVIVGGNVTFGTSASLTANGDNGANGSGQSGGGGGAGGGIIYLGYKGTLSGTASLTATGGTAGNYSGNASGSNGGAGAAGFTLSEQII